jgi:hypothetical protein
VETVYNADLTAPSPRKQRPISRNVNFLTPLTWGELSRRIDTLTALRSVIGGQGDGVD